MAEKKEEERLLARGLDGLYHPSESCGCFIGDLRPCGEIRTGCRGGLAAEIGGAHGVYSPRVVKALREVSHV